MERIAVSEDGSQLATLDCQWSTLPRITLRFWVFDPAIDNYVLNTQVDLPHSGGVASLSFQPSSSTSPLLLSVGRDCRAKLWGRSATPSSSWTCVSSLQLRGLETTAGDWSDDGTLVAVAFEHLVTLWDTSSRLRSTLAVRDESEKVVKVCFGKGSSARLVFAASNSLLTAWDLVTLAPAWSFNLVPSVNLNLLACAHNPLVALVQKEQVLLLDVASGAVEHKLDDANCTGGAAWMQDTQVSSRSSSLHYLTYGGQLNRLGMMRNLQTRPTPPRCCHKATIPPILEISSPLLLTTSPKQQLPPSLQGMVVRMRWKQFFPCLSTPCHLPHNLHQP